MWRKEIEMALQQGKTSRQERRRDELLEAAIKVFGEHGYEAATIDQIAAEAGVSKGTMYNYFSSKQDLFAQLFSRTVAADEQRMEELLRTDQAASDKIDGLLDLWFERLASYHNMGRLVLEFWASAAVGEDDGPFRGTLREMYQQTQDRLTRVLAAGAETGEFQLLHTPAVGASMIIALVDGLLLQAVTGISETIHDERIVSVLKRGIRRALCAPEGGEE
jgi:TetR/AcrR family fatty acid metabolism transcriptional regulator